MITPTDLTYTTTRIVKATSVKLCEQDESLIWWEAANWVGTMTIEYVDGGIEKIVISTEDLPEELPQVGQSIHTTRVLCAYPLGHDDGIPF